MWNSIFLENLSFSFVFCMKIARIFQILSTEIFFLCGESSPYVTFWFVHIQYLAGLASQSRINAAQPFWYIFMYRTFAHTKLFGSLSHCGIVFNNISSNFNCSFFNICFQGNSPDNLLLHSYADYPKIMINVTKRSEGWWPVRTPASCIIIPWKHFGTAYSPYQPLRLPELKQT